jgi:hypothetical protein
MKKLINSISFDPSDKARFGLIKMKNNRNLNIEE